MKTAGRTDVRFAIVLTLAFAAVVATGMAAHEIWRDEWQAWLLARDSGSPWALLHNARYEGHPAGWHMLLWAASRLTRSVVAMQALHLAIAAAAIWTLARHGPFTRLETVLIAFGYFLAYEYAVISRSYALGTLALFGACAAWRVRRESWLPLALWLALLSQTSVYGVILALAFGAAVGAEWLAGGGRRAVARRSTVAGVLIVAVSMATAVAQIAPPDDAAFNGRPATERLRGLAAARIVALIPARALVPFPKVPGGVPGWGETAVVEDPGVPGAALIGLALGAGLAVFVAGSPAALALLGAGTAGMLLFAMFFHYGYLRHQGQLLVLVLAAFWIALLPGPRMRLPVLPEAAWGRATRASRMLFGLVLFGQVAAFGALWLADLRLPFSEGRSAARTLARAADDGTVLAATNTAFAVTLSGYLDRPIHYLDEHGAGTFVVWGRGRRPTPADSIVPIAARLLGPRHTQVLLATDRPLPTPTPAGTTVERLEGDARAHLTGERFHLYRVTRGEEGG